ncbi:MAG: hypothetical protein ACRD28_05680 [Acidobacteriaceae bacterium]
MGNPPVSDNPDLDRFLFAEEKRFITGGFREYFLRKRYNFIATINNFPDISGLYSRVDQNWLEALSVFDSIQDGSWFVPAQLTNFCFREIRLAAELLFSLCTTPGFSHLRTAIESFVQAQKIIREPHLAKVWVSRDEDVVEYNKYFKAKRKENLFPQELGYAYLNGVWEMLCEAGPHPNVTSIGVSSSISTTETHATWNLNYFQVDRNEAAANLLLMTSCVLEMFKFTYSAFHTSMSSRSNLLSKLTSDLEENSRLKEKYGKGGPA